MTTLTLRRTVQCGLNNEFVTKVTDESIEIEPGIEMKVAQSVKSSPVIADVKDFLTPQQRSRDERTTILYEEFVAAYSEKRTFLKKSKRTIRCWAIAWITAIVSLIGYSLVHVLSFTDRNIGDIVILVSAIVPMLSAIIGILVIITKYVFPENEEQHITEIVKLILENDLKNKQENIKTQNGTNGNGE